MKFRIGANPTFKHDITLRDAGGKEVTVPFTFKYIRPEELQTFLDGTKGKKQVEVLAEITLDWGSAFEDADGNPIPYSPEALTMLLNEHYFGWDIWNGFIAGLSGAREKN